MTCTVWSGRPGSQSPAACAERFYIRLCNACKQFNLAVLSGTNAARKLTSCWRREAAGRKGGERVLLPAGRPRGEASPHVCPGRCTSRTQRSVSRWGCVYSSPVGVWSPMSRAARPRTRRAEGPVLRGGAVWSCVHRPRAARSVGRLATPSAPRCGHFLVFGTCAKELRNLL